VSRPPILIFGVPRSGTTLLRTVLNAHPAIACGPEAGWLADHHGPNIMALQRVLADGRYGFARSFHVPPDRVRRRIRELIDGLFSDFASSQGKARWGHKTPDDCLHVDFFTGLFPDAKYLHLERHPLDVALSTARVPEHRQGISKWHEENIVLAPGCAAANNLFNGVLRWRRWNDRLRAALATVDCLRLSYEDMVRAPEETFARVCAFLDEPFAPAMLEYGRADAILPAWEWGSADVRQNGRIVPGRADRWRTELTPAEVRVLASVAGSTPGVAAETPAAQCRRLAGVAELESPPFRALMEGLNAFAAPLGLRTFTDWSKVWEYPWLWFHGLAAVEVPAPRIVDLGSELSPMPWLLALRGARVTLIESDPQWVPVWKKVRAALDVDVDWHIVTDETLPVPDGCADAVTSLSVIEHMPDKPRAMAEVARVLKPGAPLFMSFDICEPAMGMTFPEWNGRALTLDEFDREVWRHPAFEPAAAPPWNLDDIPAFKAWHLRSAPHHDYVVGAAVLIKRR